VDKYLFLNMNRKNFLSAVLPLGAAFSAFGTGRIIEEPDTLYKIPPYLKKGDCIGITCPAGYITHEDIQPAITKMQEWGFNIKIGDTVGKKDFTLGGTDEERTKDFQQMLDNKEVKAIMCARGGYGAVRIIDTINFKKFIQHPKWVIGFSDVTVFHNHIHTNCGVATIHSKMCNSFPVDWSKADTVQIETINSIYKCLAGGKMNYSAVPNVNNKTGFGSGVLIGGNIKTIESLAASKSDINTKGKILFVEDTGEYLYSIDRMFWNLKRTGKLSGLKGLLIGGFKIKIDEDTEPFGKTIEEVVLEKVQEYKYPVCFDFPVGHQRNNFALKCGVGHKLIVQKNECTLTEIR
jgi:muramoyltetrapeptide carboxypeptidase